MGLAITLVGIGVLALGGYIFWARTERERAQLRQQSMMPEELYPLWAANEELLIFDVRQPLDLLAYPEIIPRARRILPDDVLQKPALIPKDKQAVVYCTCPGDKTSRAVMQQARAVQLSQVKFLEGGLAGWKAKGYPVEPYQEVFHLYKAAGPV